MAFTADLKRFGRLDSGHECYGLLVTGQPNISIEEIVKRHASVLADQHGWHDRDISIMSREQGIAQMAIKPSLVQKATRAWMVLERVIAETDESFDDCTMSDGFIEEVLEPYQAFVLIAPVARQALAAE